MTTHTVEERAQLIHKLNMFIIKYNNVIGDQKESRRAYYWWTAYFLLEMYLAPLPLLWLIYGLDINSTLKGVIIPIIYVGNIGINLGKYKYVGGNPQLGGPPSCGYIKQLKRQVLRYRQYLRILNNGEDLFEKEMNDIETEQYRGVISVF